MIVEQLRARADLTGVERADRELARKSTSSATPSYSRMLQIDPRQLDDPFGRQSPAVG